MKTLRRVLGERIKGLICWNYVEPNALVASYFGEGEARASENSFRFVLLAKSLDRCWTSGRK